MGTVQESLDRCNPNTLADTLRVLKFGNLLSQQLPQTVHVAAGLGALSDPSQLTTVEGIGLPETRRAAAILRANCRGGTGIGELAIQTYGTTPGSGQIAVAPNGEIVLLDADNNTEIDVLYVPQIGEVVEVANWPAPLGVLTLPSWITARGVVLLLSATATAGTITGDKIVLVPAAAAPATTKAALKTDGTKVLFNTATDGVTEATVRLLVRYATDFGAALDADSTVI